MNMAERFITFARRIGGERALVDFLPSKGANRAVT